MRPFTASDLLEIWERGAGGTPLEQALVILAAAFPQASRETLAGLTVAERDAALFRLREQTFGPRLLGLAGCPVCGEQLELDFTSGDLQGLALLPSGEVPADGLPVRVRSLRTGGYRLEYRLPTSADLLAAAAESDSGAARRRLLGACLVSARKAGQAVPLDDLPPRPLRLLLARLGREAALADLTVTAACPACGHRWEILFDIASYFWAEIGAWAARLIHEVHLLASAYGWREADILAMSAWRRERYLDLMGA